MASSSGSDPNLAGMHLRFWRKHELSVGDKFDGPVAWCADPTSGATKPAFYPAQPDGTLNFELPCAWVEAHPDDVNDNDGWFVVADLADLPNFDELPEPNVFLNDPAEVTE